MRVGRKIKCHVASYDTNVKIPGLSQQGKRWRVVTRSGKEVRFTEPDEHRAIERAKALLEINDNATTPVEVTLGELVPGLPQNFDIDGMSEAQINAVDEVYESLQDFTIDEEAARYDDEFPDAPIRLNVPDRILWPWLAHQLAHNAEAVGRKVGIPDLEERLRGSAVPRQSLKLQKLIDSYKEHNPSTDRAKRGAIAEFEWMMEQTQARTLADLSHERLLAFKRIIEESELAPGSKQFVFSKIKTIIGFGLKMGMDEVQIRSALDRCKVLWTADALPDVQPNPIRKADFHKLLTAGNGTWRAWLLVGLNLCLHIEEVCQLQWDQFDLEAGTFATIRNKTKRRRIPRAAVLWTETLEVLKKIKRTDNPYVFVSTHGTRYNRSTRVNDFRDLRTKAGLPEDVTFDTLRDGSYSAAINDPKTEERFARVLAGHRSPGLQDNYVLRNPKCVAGACEAVYRAYGPF